ncbi:MAG: hypothetical protein K9G58_08615 [Bacteroidales bacterium]|nr:hypothetical protein [Bacteroidales bacterium]MCF8387792.1 hypothetical protein [Bacteroidales bacterium]MCF8398215.1 hypothetical protein [Bacteroidales bacterium]
MKIAYLDGSGILCCSIDSAYFILPLHPLQLLSLNHFTNVITKLTCDTYKGNGNVMEQPPKDPGEPI